MENLKLCESDHRFMTVIWDNEPLPSGKLVELCSERLGWKKPTTYTTLKKLCEKGFAQNKDTIVSALIPRDRAQTYASEHFVEHTFEDFGILFRRKDAFSKGSRRIEEAY